MGSHRQNAGLSLDDSKHDCKTLCCDWTAFWQAPIVLCQIFHFVKTPQWNVIILFMCVQIYFSWWMDIKSKSPKLHIMLFTAIMKPYIVKLRSEIEMVKLKHQSYKICRLRYMNRILEYFSDPRGYCTRNIRFEKYLLLLMRLILIS